jgi:fermentation-respiration switch protein FrsA (DUF1100 family)
MRPLLHSALVVVAIGMGVFALVIALLWYFQERVVFQPPGPPYPDPGRMRRIDHVAADGQPLFAYLVGEPDSAAGLLIVFHGNADLAAWQIPWAEELSRRTGRAVLLAEYRGYGGLPGAPTYEGSGIDAHAAWTVARDTLGVPARRIALFGHSLGSAVAAELAKRVGPEVLVLQSPLTSARDMAGRMAMRPIMLLWGRIGRVHYDTEAIVRTLDAPVWVAHGTRDRVIPVEMGRRVFDAARRKGELLLIDVGHNDMDGEDYWRWLVRALTPSA